MTELRGALIGCGFFAINHLHAWRDVDGASIVAICDVDQDRLESVGNLFDIKRRYERAEMLFEKGGFDFVDIATTVGSHKYLVDLAIAHRVPVICQKPFASSLVVARSMVDACVSFGLPLMIHENFRWQSPIQAAKNAITSGGIGTPFWGRFSFRTGYDIYANQPYLADGDRLIIEDLAVHTLDIARFLLGDVNAITARTARVNPLVKGEDAATMLLDHEEGATSIVDVSYATKLDSDPFPETLVEIDGNEGSLRLRAGYSLEITNKNGTFVQDVSPKLLTWAQRPWHNVQESVFAIQQHWVDQFNAGQETSTSGKDNLRTLELVDAAYQSAASGQTVRLNGIAA
jgi:predicted dehydrogenase